MKYLNKGNTFISGLLISIALLMSCSDSAPSAVVENNKMDGSVYQVENYLKRNLKDPNSYEGIDWSPVIVDSINGKPHSYMVRHQYRAKNSFGGMTIENKVFYLDSAGTVYNVMNQ